jgi:SAM-dependent methyltransferase
VSVPGPVLALLRCPRCGAGLHEEGDGLACRGESRHVYRVEDGFLTFSAPPMGKYDPDYAARYAGLWAFGYQTLGSGLDEPLYRTVSSLAAEALAAGTVEGTSGADDAAAAAAASAAAGPVIVDCGCGVGRVAADCAALAPGGVVIGIDASLAMLEYAERIVHGEAPVEVDVSAYGFDTLAIPARGAGNVHLFRGDVENLPVADGAADLALSINVIDRLPHGPEKAFAECHRILRPGGRLIFSDPLNWTTADLWQRYGEAETIRTLLETLGFTIETSFDDLAYREILDARGSFEEFRTLISVAERT